MLSQQISKFMDTNQGVSGRAHKRTAPLEYHKLFFPRQRRVCILKWRIWVSSVNRGGFFAAHSQVKVLMSSLQWTVSCTSLPSKQSVIEKKNHVKMLQWNLVLAFQIKAWRGNWNDKRVIRTKQGKKQGWQDTSSKCQHFPELLIQTLFHEQNGLHF